MRSYAKKLNSSALLALIVCQSYDVSAAVTANPSLVTSPAPASIPALSVWALAVLSVATAVVLNKCQPTTRRGVGMLALSAILIAYKDEIAGIAKAANFVIPGAVSINSSAQSAVTQIDVMSVYGVYCPGGVGVGTYSVEAGVYNATSTNLDLSTINLPTVTAPTTVAMVTPSQSPECTTSTVLLANQSSAQCYVKFAGNC